MQDRKDRLIFIYTLSCPLRCDYCCFPLEILGEGKLDPARTLRIIEDAASLGTIYSLEFTGGEPFLYYGELKSILEGSLTRDLVTRIATSAYWAESEEKARWMLSELSSVGLDEIFLTTDPSHQAFVPVERVKNAACAALSLGIGVIVSGSFWEPGHDIRSFLNLPESKAISFNQAPVLPTGRARSHRINRQDQGLEVLPSRSGGCRGNTRGMDITIFPDGTVYPCCSCGFNIEGDLGAGNVFREPLKDIADRMWADPFVRVMLGAGTEVIYELCRWKSPGLFRMLPEDDHFCTICQVCARLHRDARLRESLGPVLEYGLEVLDRADRLREEGMRRHERDQSRLVPSS